MYRIVVTEDLRAPARNGVESDESAPAPHRAAPFEIAPVLCLILRTGTLFYSRSGADTPTGPEDIALFDDVEETLWDYRRRGYRIFALANRDAIAPSDIPLAAYRGAEIKALLSQFLEEPPPLDQVCECLHPAETAPENPQRLRSLSRLPEIGMLANLETEWRQTGRVLDWKKSLLVGSGETDAECARRAGIAFMPATAFFGRSLLSSESGIASGEGSSAEGTGQARP
jgi:histidinol phosphatase-like enzyme